MICLKSTVWVHFVIKLYNNVFYSVGNIKVSSQFLKDVGVNRLKYASLLRLGPCNNSPRKIAELWHAYGKTASPCGRARLAVRRGVKFCFNGWGITGCTRQIAHSLLVVEMEIYTAWLQCAYCYFEVVLWNCSFCKRQIEAGTQQRNYPDCVGNHAKIWAFFNIINALIRRS